MSRPEFSTSFVKSAICQLYRVYKVYKDNYRWWIEDVEGGVCKLCLCSIGWMGGGGALNLKKPDQGLKPKTCQVWIRVLYYDVLFQILVSGENGPRCLSWCSYSLRAGRSGVRIPVGARFSSPVQTVFGALPASYIMGFGSLPGGKEAGAWR